MAHSQYLRIMGELYARDLCVPILKVECRNQSLWVNYQDRSIYGSHSQEPRILGNVYGSTRVV